MWKTKLNMRKNWELLSAIPWNNEIMKEENSKTSYEIVFESLLNNGYSEKEGEELLYRAMQEQIEFPKTIGRINQILSNVHTK